MKHTPGPWKLKQVGEDSWEIWSEPRKVICEYAYEDDANLIAAAPEMYEALREIQECLEDHGRFNLLSPAVATALDIARAAFTKAEGKK